MKMARAQSVVRESSQVFEALATGKPLPPTKQLSVDLDRISRAVRAYAKAHEGFLPAHLADVAPYVERTKRMNEDEVVRLFLPTRKRADVVIPRPAPPDWISRHSSLVYLGNRGVRLRDCEDVNRLILVHTGDDDEVSIPWNGGTAPARHTMTIAGGVTTTHAGYCRTLAEESARVLKAMGEGKPLPDYQQSLRDVRLILGSIVAYARDHEGKCPGSLGEATPYLSPEFLQGASWETIYRVYLSPREKRSRQAFPDDLDANWINQHASYKYLGNSDLRLADAARAMAVLIHGPVGEPITVQHAVGERAEIPWGDAYGGVWSGLREELEERIASSAAALKTGKK
jgi:hypothetical protein